MGKFCDFVLLVGRALTAVAVRALGVIVGVSVTFANTVAVFVFLTAEATDVFLTTG